MRSALVNLQTGLVENLIVADPAVDSAPEGYSLIGDPPDFVQIGSEYPFVDPVVLFAPDDGML